MVLSRRGTDPMIRDMTPDERRRRSAGRPGRAAESTTARAHTVALRGIPLVLKQFGISSEPILGSINLHLADLDDPDHSASFADLDRLFGLCLRRTKCGHFGLLVGQYIDLTKFTRAFARWTGRTPSRFRAELADGSRATY